MKKSVFLTMIIFLGVLLLVMPLILAGLSDWIKEMTGKATEQTVELNISVGAGDAPTIKVHNLTMTDVSTGPNEGPSSTTLEINLTAYDANGFGNLNDSSAQINFTKGGETTRTNSSCQWTADYSTNYANYTCTVIMYWWDGTGTWDIGATIEDINNNVGTNTSQDFYIGATTGVVSSPAALTWSTINPGSTNQEANEQILMNNTGNIDRNIQVNATHLRGETTSSLALWAGNFTVKNAAGCEGTAMTDHDFVTVSSASLPAGNFTINDKSTGQEEIYFCLEEAGTELTEQAYSTSQDGTWTIKIIA